MYASALPVLQSLGQPYPTNTLPLAGDTSYWLGAAPGGVPGPQLEPIPSYCLARVPPHAADVRTCPQQCTVMDYTQQLRRGLSGSSLLIVSAIVGRPEA